ncbi:dephospho-CoA kinase [Paracandidimonas soli]|uniref:Dephospho-CoA kinase n=1 Tax=Paracandidimonas soli TaxID=1917182 RepID=A0A4R3V4N5_9BURK|nr:dephospho-CoA kinase [Paracandidimonas soli]TCU98501.1 dephospho-CoA kinase [Paracandidimonas soli]
MFRIGLTGGIGSGKNLVADLLMRRGVPVVDADAVAHALTAPGGAAMPAIRQAFGDTVIRPDGALDRDVMRSLIFSDQSLRVRLEALLHPMIYNEMKRQAALAQGPYAVFAVPLLVESGRWRHRVQRICVVDCEPATQVARVQVRSGLTPEVIERIMSAQATRDDRLAAADDVVFNGADTSLDELAASVDALHDKWLALAAQR